MFSNYAKNLGVQISSPVEEQLPSFSMRPAVAADGGSLLAEQSEPAMDGSSELSDEEIVPLPPTVVEKHGKSRLDIASAHSEDTASWGILLIDSNETKYLFVRGLSGGMQGITQLCVGDDGHLVVRKRTVSSIAASRAVRRDREARIAEEVRHKLKRSPPADLAGSPRFAVLLADETLPTEDDENMFFRESWWEFCDGGGNLSDFLMFLFRQNNRPGALPLQPRALILNIVHRVLLSLQWLNGQGIHHLDSHTKNIFLAWEGDTLVPVIGDFGYSRDALEPPYNDRRLWYPNSGLTEAQKAALSSPPGDTDCLSSEDRLPSDYVKFLHALRVLLLMLFPSSQKPDPEHAEMFDTIDSLLAIGEQEREDNQLPEGERPPRADVSREIARFKAAEQQYLARGGAADNDRALAAWRARAGPVAAGAPGRALVFSTMAGAAAAAREQLGAHGPYAVVDLRDEASVRAGVARLRSLRSSRSPAGRDDGDNSRDPAPGGSGGGASPSSGSSADGERHGGGRETPRSDSSPAGSASSPPSSSSPGGPGRRAAPRGPAPTSSFVPVPRGLDEAALFLATGAEHRVREARDRAAAGEARLQALVRRLAPRANRVPAASSSSSSSAAERMAGEVSELRIQRLREEVARAEAQRRGGRGGLASGIRARFV